MLQPSKFSAKFESAIATDDIVFVEDKAEKDKVLIDLLDRYSPEYKEIGMKFVSDPLEKRQLCSNEGQGNHRQGKIQLGVCGNNAKNGWYSLFVFQMYGLSRLLEYCSYGWRCCFAITNFELLTYFYY